MKPAARIKAVIEVLEGLETSRVPMDGTVGDYMRGRRYIGSKDRAAIVETVYGIVRARARLGWLLERVGGAFGPRAAVLAWLAAAEQKPADQIAAFFDGDKYSPAPLSEDENRILEALSGTALDDAAMPEGARLECPPQHEAVLRGLFGDDFAAEMDAMMESAPLDLRVNTRLKSREEAQASLQKDKVPCDITPYSPWGLRARGKAFLSRTKAFVKGWVDIQDEGSQLIACLCDAQPGMQVLDYCAGAGGKTLALAAAMNNKGRIVAMDTDKNRLERSRARFRRAHVHDVIEVRALSDEKNRKWLRRQKESFDVVLADVPCGGSGTWRRNPDLRWRQFGPGLEELLATQAEILERVAKTVKPGGRLVYATCSLLPAENEGQVEKFLQAHPEFEILPLTEAWPAGLNAPGPGPFMRLTPHRHNTDGFFGAALRRRTAD